MAKLVFKVRSESRYAKFPFPLPLRPQDEELLSSWLIRLALLHRTAPTTFTNLYLPETRNKLWSADLDLQADEPLLSRLSQKSGIAVGLLRAMTLGSYEGVLFERRCRESRGTPFVNPLGLRGRRCTLPGVRYCPGCLREDESPYLRKAWRLAISVACPAHGCVLLDRCSGCGKPLTPYLCGANGPFRTCHQCGGDLVANKIAGIPASPEVLEVVRRLLAVMTEGYVLVDDRPVYSHLYFRVVHQMLKLLVSGKHGPKLRAGVGLKGCAVPNGKAFEAIPIEKQALLLTKVVWVLDDWPARFVGVCEKEKLFSSVLLKDFQDAPFWFWAVVLESLYHADRKVSETEVRAALRYMERQGMEYSERALSRLLGVGQVFRKRGSEFREGVMNVQD